MPNSLPSINLVKNKESSLFSQSIDWTLTIGRIAVIMAEVIAVAAFIYRFSLDQRLVNLHSEIKQKQSIISSLKNDEGKYRNLQSRIALAATFSDRGVKSSQNITDFGKLIPSDIKLTNLIFDKNQVNIIINADSVLPLSNLVDSLKKYNGAKSISIDSIENKPSIGLSVNISVLLK